MKSFLRFALYLALSLWLGAELFFPFLAATIFHALQPDTHTAGFLVGRLLTGLHSLGMAAAVMLILVLILAFLRSLYRAHHVGLLLGLVLAMASLTLHSQFGITPRMEADRIAAGGAVDAAAADNLARIDFKRLHQRSENIEGVIMLFGLLALYTLARAEALVSEPEAGPRD
jgi:hypothetical protein